MSIGLSRSVKIEGQTKHTNAATRNRDLFKKSAKVRLLFRLSYIALNFNTAVIFVFKTQDTKNPLQDFTED